MKEISLVILLVQCLLLSYFHCFADNNSFHLTSQLHLTQQHNLLGSSPAFSGCEKNLVPSPNVKPIKSYIINLDLPPKKRWTEVVQDKKTELLSLLASVRENTDEWFGKKVFELIDEYFPKLARTLPKIFCEEMEGIAETMNVTIAEATLFNVFYEFFTVCTSIIAQTPDGHMYHARNLDFGLFLGWDILNKTWLTTEQLRPLVVELQFQRNQKTIFQTVNFAGYLGVLTGMKPGKFSLTINERFKLNGGFIGVIEWIIGLRNQQWIGFLTRSVMESAENYMSAQKILSKTALVSPVYFILSGTKSYQGCIITRGRTNFDIQALSSARSWFLVQTNYDHWKTPPIYDDRRTPAKTCLDALGNIKMNHTLFNVLSTKPVLNKLTVYTTIIDNNAGKMSTWIQDCKDPCWPW